MNKICIFAGTTEGRIIAEHLKSFDVSVTVCVATDYGKEMIVEGGNISVQEGRLDESQMEKLFKESLFDAVIDATHPYATLVTKNIKEACDNTETKYMRVVRAKSNTNEYKVTYAESFPDAISLLKETKGNILLTSGSKELGFFKEENEILPRLFVRVLPSEESIKLCTDAGVKRSNIIAMQGPFSTKMNKAMIRETGAGVLVTKDGGDKGGFYQKIEAAKELGIDVIVIGREDEFFGMSLEEIIGEIDSKISATGNLNMYDTSTAKIVNAKNNKERNISIIGAGTGNTDMLTELASDRIKSADILIGASRLVSCFKNAYDFKGEMHTAYLADDIYKIITKSKGNIAVLMSGDTGFYSGCTKLSQILDEENITYEIIPGISSFSYFMSKVKLSYEDAKFVSLHARDCNLESAVRENEKVFVLLDKNNTPDSVCRKMMELGYNNLTVYVGERLGMDGENIIASCPQKIAEQSFDPLSVMLIVNRNAKRRLQVGIPDDCFARSEKIPMTKSEVRALCMSKLKLTSDSYLLDVGCGTGSVSVEAALNLPDGKVIALDKKEECIRLAKDNAKRFSISNIRFVKGDAIDYVNSLENISLTHAFIGGCGSDIEEVIKVLLERNQGIRIVATAVTAETISRLTNAVNKFEELETEIFTVNISRSKKVGKYNLMEAGNPVWIFTIQG